MGEWVKIYDCAIRKPKPCPILSNGKDFALRDGNKIYFFIHNLGIGGNTDVTVNESQFQSAARSFGGIKETIQSIKWLDNGENLHFVQMPEDEMLLFHATSFPYGQNLVVRVAEAECK